MIGQDLPCLVLYIAFLAEVEDECGETSGEDCDDAEEGGTAIGVAIKDLWVEWVLLLFLCCNQLGTGVFTQ